MRRRGKVDSNQREIIRALRKAGCSVVSLSNLGDGICDLLVGHRNRNYLLECKTKDGDLTEEQELFFKTWQGQRAIVREPIEALRVIGLIL